MYFVDPDQNRRLVVQFPIDAVSSCLPAAAEAAADAFSARTPRVEGLALEGRAWGPRGGASATRTGGRAHRYDASICQWRLACLRSPAMMPSSMAHGVARMCAPRY